MNSEKRPLENILEDILAWIRFQNLPRLKKVIKESLESDQDKWIYELTDGKLSSREIAMRLGISQTTVSNYWRKWHKMGIVRRLEAGSVSRYEKLISLEDVGIRLEGLNLENKTKEDAPIE